MIYLSKLNNMVKPNSMKYLASLSLLCPSVAFAAEHPNIIYIFTDQQTANAMSCAEIRIYILLILTGWLLPV